VKSSRNCSAASRTLAWAALASIPFACSHRQSPEDIVRQATALRERGEFKPALALTDRGLGRTTAGTLPYWKLRLLKAEILLSLGRASETTVLLADNAPVEIQPRLLLDRGWATDAGSKHAAAIALFDRAAEQARGQGALDLLAQAELRRGAARAGNGDAAGAERDFRDALNLANRLNSPFLRASALGNLGVTYVNHERYDEAILMLTQTLPIWRSLGARPQEGRTLSNLGWAYYHLGDMPKALSLLQQAATTTLESGEKRDRQMSLGHIGGCYDALGRYPEARDYYERALKTASELQNRDWESYWLNRLASVSIETGDLDGAEGYNNRDLGIAAQLPDPLAAQRVRLNAARIARGRGQFPEAERLFRAILGAGAEGPDVNLEAESGLAAVLAATGRTGEADAEFRKAIALADRSRAKLVKDEYKLSYFASLVRFYHEYVEFLSSQSRPVDALLVAESSRARVLSERLGLDTSGGGGDASRFQNLARDSKTVLLCYWLAPRRSFLWAVTPSTIVQVELPPEEQIARLAESYRRGIEGLRDPLDMDAGPGVDLYRALIQPVKDLIPSGSHVAIVPDGALHNLNFATLVVPGGHPRYWAEDVTVAIVPSLGVALHQRREPRRDAQSLLLIGDPVSADEKEFPALAAAGAEIAAIEKQFADSARTTYTQASAQPAVYRESSPARFDVIHFAAHATANAGDPLDSAVILTPGKDSFKLYARDIAGIPISARLVTLSACRGAGARTYSGEGLVGFSWAFLEAGARNVIAGLWEVDDQSTAVMMRELYAGIRRGDSPPDALRTAELQLIRSTGPYRKPYYWAPFEVFTRSLQAR
jgi:CHAT domain-containing protein/tetratricopeptide (TPR) repeat protein